MSAMSIQAKQLREALSQYPANLLDRAIASLAAAHDWTKSDIVRSVDPNRVLAEAWHSGQLDRCRRLLADGKQAPAIRVVAIDSAALLCTASSTACTARLRTAKPERELRRRLRAIAPSSRRATCFGVTVFGEYLMEAEMGSSATKSAAKFYTRLASRPESKARTKTVPLFCGGTIWGKKESNFKGDGREWRSLGDSNPCFRRERARATASIRHVILRID